MKMVSRIFFFWFPVILWMGLIYFLSSFHKLQASSVSWQDFIVRKTAHFFEYVILFILFHRGFNHTVKMPAKKNLIWSLILTVAYAISDEFHQTMVSGRTGRPFDIGIDSLGAIAGLFFVLKLVKYLPEKFRKVADI